MFHTHSEEKADEVTVGLTCATRGKSGREQARLARRAVHMSLASEISSLVCDVV